MTKTASGRPGRTVRFWILYFALSGLLAAAAGEGIARLLQLGPTLDWQYSNYVPDPVLPYRHAPNSHRWGRSASDEFDYDYRFNSRGFRDAERQLEKPVGVFRVLVLGDSFTLGAGVTPEETFVRRLEEMLNRRTGEHPPVEILNLGVSRFSPLAEELLLRHEGLSYEPDLVLAVFIPNDVIDTAIGLQAIEVSDQGFLLTREARDLGRLGTWLYLNSRAARIVLLRYVDWRGRARMPPVSWSEIYRDGGLHEKDWRAIESCYRRMAADSNARGARFAVVHVPQKGPWSEAEHYPGRRLAAFAEREEILSVDTLPALQRAAGEELLYWERDGHPTAAGHEVVARALFDHLGGGTVP